MNMFPIDIQVYASYNACMQDIETLLHFWLSIIRGHRVFKSSKCLSLILHNHCQQER